MTKVVFLIQGFIYFSGLIKIYLYGIVGTDKTKCKKKQNENCFA
jgi:hypothetical protein